MFVKDPSADLDYGFDWEGWLASGDTISSSTWSVKPTGTSLTLSQETHDDNTTKVWLEDGDEGTRYTLTNKIVTNGGREDERSFVIKIQQR